ncbi:MAG: hypothetical protein ACOCQD_05025 [archaeon]
MASRGYLVLKLENVKEALTKEEYRELLNLVETVTDYEEEQEIFKEYDVTEIEE